MSWPKATSTLFSPLAIYLMMSVMTIMVSAPDRCVAKPKGLIIPLAQSENVATDLESKLNATLNESLGASLELVSAQLTESSIKEVSCKGSECTSKSAEISKRSGARFIVVPFVKNEFDVYQLKLTVTDADFVTAPPVVVTGVCEFCEEGQGVAAKLKEMTSDAKLKAALEKPGVPKGPTSFTLSVITSPKGAEVWVNAKRAGVSPLSIPDLKAQAYEVEVKLKGHKSEKRTIKPPKPLPEAPFNVSFTLKPVRPTVFPLIVKSAPPGATVTLDDRTLKVPSPFKAKVRAGKHTIKMQLKGYEPYSYTFTTPIKLETIEVNAILKPIAPPKPVKPKTPKQAPPVMVTQTPLPPPPGILKPALSGSLIGLGVVAVGAGAWMLNLHGEITCGDDKTRVTCPTIYDTKYTAGGLLGVGAVSVGAGLVSMWLNKQWPRRRTAEPKAPAPPKPVEDPQSSDDGVEAEGEDAGEGSGEGEGEGEDAGEGEESQSEE